MRYAVLFPGQGSQFVGMGRDVFDARPDLLGERADEILGWSLRSMCLEGPEEELTSTEHAQPALFGVAHALWDELVKRLPVPPAAAAGHSLGEYTALTAAGAIAPDRALSVVAERGAAMQAAADLEPSGMAALLGADFDFAEELCFRRREDGGRLTVANMNAPGQVVVAGSDDDLDWLEANSREVGVRKVVRLKVAGAFHSPFMRPAADRVAAALAGVEIGPLAFPVYANVTAAPIGREEVAETLATQVVAPVRFSETLSNMAAEGIEAFIHVGPGDVTIGMAKRAAPGTATLAVSDLAGIEAATELVAG
jgi:[acyl-carrier-protein] S-malonyltransferase